MKMALSITDVLKKEDLESLLGRDISIDPSRSYNEKYFVKNCGNYFNLKDSYLALRENSNNFDAMENIAELLIPKNADLLINRGPRAVLKVADVQLAKAEISLAQYTERNNLDEKLNGNQLNNLILLLGNPDFFLLYKTGDKSHDKLVEIVKRQSIVMFGKKEKLLEDVRDLMKVAPLWHQVMYSAYSNDHSYMGEFLESYTDIIKEIYTKEFTKEITKGGKKERKPDKAKLLNFYRKNLESAKTKMNSEADEKKKLKIWNEKIKPIYLMVAQSLYEGKK